MVMTTIPKLYAIMIGAITCIVDGACTYPLPDYGACTYPLLVSGACTLPHLQNLVSCLYLKKNKKTTYTKITEGISVAHLSTLTKLVSKLQRCVSACHCT